MATRAERHLLPPRYSSCFKVILSIRFANDRFAQIFKILRKILNSNRATSPQVVRFLMAFLIRIEVLFQMTVPVNFSDMGCLLETNYTFKCNDR